MRSETVTTVLPVAKERAFRLPRRHREPAGVGDRVRARAARGGRRVPGREQPRRVRVQDPRRRADGRDRRVRRTVPGGAGAVPDAGGEPARWTDELFLHDVPGPRQPEILESQHASLKRELEYPPMAARPRFGPRARAAWSRRSPGRSAGPRAAGLRREAGRDGRGGLAGEVPRSCEGHVGASPRMVGRRPSLPLASSHRRPAMVGVSSTSKSSKIRPIRAACSGSAASARSSRRPSKNSPQRASLRVRCSRRSGWGTRFASSLIPGQVARQERRQLEAPRGVLVAHVVSQAAQQLRRLGHGGLHPSVHRPRRDRLRGDRDAQLAGRGAGGLHKRSLGRWRHVAVALGGAATTSRKSAVSSTLRETQPATESPNQWRASGRSETRPRWGLSPNSPQHAAGMRIEPPPSLAVATPTMPAATAVPEPPLEPPEERSGFHGLRVMPQVFDSVKGWIASSGRWVFPIGMAPAARRRLTISASSVAGSVKPSVPWAVSSPAMSWLSLTPTGTPRRGRSSPRRAARRPGPPPRAPARRARP